MSVCIIHCSQGRKGERSRRNVLQSKIKVKRYWRVNLLGLDADLFNQCLGVNSELV